MSKELPELPVLIVDDEYPVLKSFDRMLRSGGFPLPLLCDDAREVLPTLRDVDIGVVLLDLEMPHLRVDELIPLLSEKYPEVPVIVVTVTNEVKRAVRCMKEGAYDYMAKPVDPDQLILTVRRAYEMRASCFVFPMKRRGVPKSMPKSREATRKGRSDNETRTVNRRRRRRNPRDAQ